MISSLILEAEDDSFAVRVYVNVEGRLRSGVAQQTPDKPGVRAFKGGSDP